MILGGTVRYEDAVKQNPADQYSTSRKVAVELNFAVPEDPGIDPSSVVRAAMEEAINLTNEKLGIKTATRNAKTTVVETGRTKADLEKEATEKAEGKKRGPKPKADAAKSGAQSATATQPATASDDWETTATTAQTQAIASTEVAADEWEVPAQTEITDAELHKAVQGKAETVDAEKIRKLIATFNPDPKKPFKIAMIAQASRQSFLDKLKDLA